MEPPTPGSLDNPDLGSSLNEVFTPEMREKMVRLEKENEILRRRLAEGAVEVGGGGVRTGGRGGGEGEESVNRGRGVRGGEQMVAVLRKQLQEKEKKISQLEAAAQENSKFSPSSFCYILLLSPSSTHLIVFRRSFSSLTSLSFLCSSCYCSSFFLLPFLLLFPSRISGQ